MSVQISGGDVRELIDFTDLDIFAAGGVPHDKLTVLRAEQPVYWHPTTGDSGFSSPGERHPATFTCRSSHGSDARERRVPLRPVDRAGDRPGGQVIPVKRDPFPEQLAMISYRVTTGSAVN